MYKYPKKYDIIVVGAGHAGAEAAYASAKMGDKTLLLSINLDTTAQMSCNPAIGGLGKTHLVREIDALGGIMAEAIDHTGIQFRMLNTRKGPAVQALRAQADRWLYQKYVQHKLEATENLDMKQAVAEAISTNDNRANGVITKDGIFFESEAVILTTGTFLKGLIHIGETMFTGGRYGEPSAENLSGSLLKLGLEVGRLKTGTPPRLNARTIDFSKLTEQPGAENLPAFSFKYSRPPVLDKYPQVSCHVTRTTSETKKIIEDNFDRAPLFTGQIKGTGPRYCPSIEDKVHRFSDKDSHQIFLEPEGRGSNEIYPNGVSTSLPYDVQIKMLHSIPGLENVEIMRPGYAIEYDYCNPQGLFPTLENKTVPNLFFAGQINGTSGYEEAGAQGIYAAINAVSKIREKEPLLLNRSDAYIAVMIDDLVTLGTEEPYRMFTSRAEYRLLLRQDNADLRLTDYGFKYGLISKERYETFLKKKDGISKELKLIKSISKCNKTLFKFLGKPDTTPEDYAELRGKAIDKLLSQNSTNEFEQCLKLTPDPNVIEQVLIECKYAGYIDRQKSQIKKLEKMERKKIPDNFDYTKVPGLRNEGKNKLTEIQPKTVGQASRIQGVTPADIALLIARLER